MRAIGSPYRVGLCHCLDCRKTHAAPFMAFVIFRGVQVSIANRTGGALPKGALGYFDSQNGYRRFFCIACGSHVFGRTEGADEIELHLGSFDETNLWTPTYEVWTKRREHWLGALPNIKQHFDMNRERGGDDTA
jgi:hypothetical protein